MSAKLFFVILLILGGVIVFGVVRKSKSMPALTPQIKTMGAVEVKATPKTLIKDKEMVFEVGLNTHSVDLGYDYLKIATLTDNLGKSYKALNWSGENSGHHLSGELIFEPLSTKAQKIILNIDGIDNQSASFSWNL